MRVISLLPSATEIVCALGATDELVGISHERDFPPTAVRVVIRDALSIYEVDEAQLAARHADVIVPLA